MWVELIGSYHDDDNRGGGTLIAAIEWYGIRIWDIKLGRAARY